MANNLTTCTSSVCVPTPSTGYTTTAEWVDGHADDFDDADPQPLGDTLTASWVTAGGDTALNPPTTREPGESDEDFKQRHFERLLLALNPPNPPPVR